MLTVKFWERILFGLTRFRKYLTERHRKAWNGLSILIVREDSAFTPRRHRINYYVLVFFGMLLVSVPIFAAGLYVERRIKRADPRDLLMDRMILLNTMRLITREKRALFDRVEDQMIDLHRNSAGTDQELLRRLTGRRYSHASAGFEQPGVSNVTRDLMDIQRLRSRAIVLKHASYFSLNLLWNRMVIHHIMPREWPVVAGQGVEITSSYGHRHFGHGEFHAAYDIGAPIGQDIYATAPGVVTHAVSRITMGYGRFVTLHHGFGFGTLYAHCSEIFVEKGQHVKRGQLIAKVGLTGRTTGSHVHYEVLLGTRKIDPLPYLKGPGNL